MLDAEQGLLAAHGHLMQNPASNVEGLDRAGCSNHITELARLAMGASFEGISADQWRAWVRESLGDRGDVALAAAETCMRTNGAMALAGLSRCSIPRPDASAPARGASRPPDINLQQSRS